MKSALVEETFSRFAIWAARVSGSWQAFCLALTLIILWLLAGLHFGYTNEMYQLAVNSGTTVITFLMVFLLQHTQTRDTVAIKVQLGELIRATTKARNDLISLEHLTDSQLQDLVTLYEKRAKAQDNLPGDHA
jgi:low affinity Fe/Cu permease